MIADWPRTILIAWAVGALEVFFVCLTERQHAHVAALLALLWPGVFVALTVAAVGKACGFWRRGL